MLLFIAPIISSGQIKTLTDSTKYISEFSTPADTNKKFDRKSSDNFYKTDSIFSFRSQKGYFPSLAYNFGEQLTSPLRFTAKEWIITGAAVGITIVLVNVDGDIDEWARVQKNKYKWVDVSSPNVTQIGGKYGICAVLATGVVSAAFQYKKGVETSLLASQAVITSGVWANLIKLMTGRERPMADYVYSRHEGGTWYGPFAVFDQDLAKRKPKSSFDSFPSGHTATAFSIASVFASMYNETKVVPVICYSLATAVGISRLTEHEHWASDVFVGGLLGYACGKQVVKHFNKIHQTPLASRSMKSKNKPEVTFIQAGNQVGLSLKW